MRVFCAPILLVLLYLKRWFFFGTIGIFCKSIVVPRIGWSIYFNSWTSWSLYVVIPMSLCKIRLNDVQSLRTTATYTHFLPQHHDSRVYALFLAFHALVYRGGWQFFHFFHKITNIRRWRCFSSSESRTQFSHIFCNITVIFKVISQYFPAFFKRIHNHIHSAEGWN